MATRLPVEGSALNTPLITFNPANSLPTPRLPGGSELAETAAAAIPKPNNSAFIIADELVARPADPFVLLRTLGLQSLQVYRWNKGQPLPAPQSPVFTPTSEKSFTRIIEPGEERRLQGGQSLLGNIIETDLILKSGRYTEPTTGAIVEFQGLAMETVLIEWTHETHLPETDLTDSEQNLLQRTGRRRSFVIRGMLVGAGALYPLDEMRVLMNLCDVKASIEVVSDLLNTCFGVYRLAIQRCNGAQEPGNSQVFELLALEDRIDITGGELIES